MELYTEYFRLVDFLWLAYIMTNLLSFKIDRKTFLAGHFHRLTSKIVKRVVVASSETNLLFYYKLSIIYYYLNMLSNLLKLFYALDSSIFN